MKIKYRPEIDGLRAISVLAVIFYHAQITIFGHQPFKGGFIGVDVFFVISGYLITSIILTELKTQSSFSFKNFYQRRIRRILPALVFVMLLSLPIAWICLLPNEYIDFSKSILYSLGFSSNFYFHYSGQEYAAENGLLKPFLHTWSLSVEEQYYILFPITLIILFKYFKKYLIPILLISFVVSLILADWTSKKYPSSSFYFLHTRMWELLAGSILAYFEINKYRQIKKKFINKLFPKIGLALIILTIVFFKLYFSHPSFLSFLPILGVCLIIWYSQKDELITKILSSNLLVKIGLISYSLYLWHFPIFAFGQILEFTQDNLSKKIFLILVTIIISNITYYMIEKPARNQNIKASTVFCLIISCILVLIISNTYIIWKDGNKNRLPEILNNNLSEKPWLLLKNLNGKICQNNIEGCTFNTSSNKKVYVIGDSHLGSLAFELKDKILKKNYQFLTFTSGCLYLPGFNRVDIKTKEIDKYCNDNYFKKIKKNLLLENNSIIIFGGRYPLHLSNYWFDNKEGGIEGSKWNNNYVSTGKYKTIQDSFKSEILELSKKNNIILIYPIPEVGWNPNKKIFLQWIKTKINPLDNFVIKNVNTSYKVYKERTKTSFELLDSIQNKNIYRVYPQKLFCDTLIKERCATHDEKRIFYSDSNHPSLLGAEMINSLIIEEIEKIEASSK